MSAFDTLTARHRAQFGKRLILTAE